MKKSWKFFRKNEKEWNFEEMVMNYSKVSINFEFDDKYQATLLETQKVIEGRVHNAEKNQKIIDKVMPVLKGFMSAISD